MTRSRAGECARMRDNERISAFQRRVLPFRSISRSRIPPPPPPPVLNWENCSQPTDGRTDGRQTRRKCDDTKTAFCISNLLTCP